MSDLNNKAEQERVLKDILSRYDETTTKLYFSILKMYNDKGASMSKKAVRDDILDKVKEAVK